MPVFGVPTCRSTRLLIRPPRSSSGASSPASAAAPGPGSRCRTAPRPSRGHPAAGRQVRRAQRSQRRGSAGRCARRAGAAQSSCSAGRPSGSPGASASHGRRVRVSRAVRSSPGTCRPRTRAILRAEIRHLGRGRGRQLDRASYAEQVRQRGRVEHDMHVARADLARPLPRDQGDVRAARAAGRAPPGAGSRPATTGLPGRSSARSRRRPASAPESAPRTMTRASSPPGGRPRATRPARIGADQLRVADQPVAGAPRPGGPGRVRRRGRRPPPRPR